MNASLVTSTLPSRSAVYPRRSHSIGNLRSQRRRAEEEEMPTPKPLAQCKSASQSRASVRSFKRRAPQPVGPPQVASTSAGYAVVSPPLYADTVNRAAHRHNPNQRPDVQPPQPPIYNQPYQKDNPYATPHMPPPTRRESTPNKPTPSKSAPAAGRSTPPVRPLDRSIPSTPTTDQPTPPTTPSVSSDTEEMPILRPVFKPRPTVAPKPKLAYSPTTGRPY